MRYQILPSTLGDPHKFYVHSPDNEPLGVLKISRDSANRAPYIGKFSKFTNICLNDKVLLRALRMISWTDFGHRASSGIRQQFSEGLVRIIRNLERA